MLGAQANQCLGDDRCPVWLGDPDDLPLHARGIRQRTDQIHQRGRAELTTNGAHVLHRRVKTRGEQEHDARFAQHTTRARGIQHNANA